MIEPLGYHVLIKPEEVEKVSKGGIITMRDSQVNAAEKASVCGKVVSVGSLAWKRNEFGIEAWAEVGDNVLFAKYSGERVVDPATGELYFLIADEDVRCKYSD